MIGSFAPSGLHRFCLASLLCLPYLGSTITGCTTLKNAGPNEASTEAIIKFFFIVNESGRDVKVKVRADDRTLFVQEIGASEKVSAAAEQAPPPAKWPARELKVAISRSTKRLFVEETNEGLKKEFTVADVVKVDGGFRIVIQEKKVLISQDYFPVR